MGVGVVGGDAVQNDFVELSDAIGVVREQLVAAQLEGRRVVAGQVLTFAVGKVAVEFSGEVKRSAGAAGGLKFWVVSADAKAEQSLSASHKVTIELIPRTSDGKSYIINDSLSELPDE